MMFSCSSNQTNPVTLNSFQGPAVREPRADRRRTVPTGLLAKARTGLGAKWTLKQVQGDEIGGRVK